MAQEDKLNTVAEKTEGSVSALFQASQDGLKLFVTLKRLAPAPDPKTAAAPKDGTPKEEAAVESKPESPPFTAAQLRAMIGTLADQSLIHGEIVEQLAVELTNQAAAAAGKPLERRRIAKGRAAVPGKDGKLLLLVKKFEQKSSKLPPEIVDPRYIHFFDNVEPKTVVGRLYAPSPGINGVSFDGKSIPFPPGKSFEPKLDPSITLGSAKGSFQELTSEQAGYLTEEKGVLMVKNELVIGGDLDFRFGDVDFVGAVKIRGSVQKNFVVKARGDIEISGDVNQGRLISKQGSVTVNGSFVGERVQSLQITEATSHKAMDERIQNRGVDISSAKGVAISRAENAVIEAGSDVTIKKEIKTCCLRTRTNLCVPDGQIVGGEIYAVCGVEAGTIGTDVGTPTIIYAVSDIESSGEYAAIDQQLKSHEAAEEMIKLYLGPYLKMPNRVARLNHDYRKKIEDMMRKLKGVESAKARLLEELDKLMAGATHSAVFRVNVKKIAHAGVKLVAEEEQLQLSEDLKGPVTIEYNGTEKKFTTGELKPVTCEMEKRPAVKRTTKK